MVVRQNATPVSYDQTVRPDNASILTSGKAGEVIPFTAIPLHRGDSASGRIDVSLVLAEMSKPLENAVLARLQAWFVPRPALPQFSGLDEIVHAYHGTDITALGSAARTPNSYFSTVGTGAIAAAQASEFFRALGLSLQPATAINTDYIDAYNLIQNFRLAAYSSKMTRYDYYAEDAVTSLELKPAFWPVNRLHNVVADYEAALVTGSLDLDVAAGSIPVHGIFIGNTYAANAKSAGSFNETGGGQDAHTGWVIRDTAGAVGQATMTVEEDPSNTGFPAIFAEMAGQSITTTLADIDKARTTNAFAKIMASYEGSNYSGFNNDDVIMSELMQGFEVPKELLNRPWLLDNKTIVFGMAERHATDAANLDDSVSTGMASASLSINVPKAQYGGVIIATVEVMPERLYERQADEYLYCVTPDDLPSALRDMQRPTPVDTVLNRRVDTLHTTPNGTYGYEPMNAKWKRERTSLGGEFRQLVPGTPATTARTAIWQADFVDPVFTDDHWLVPHPFPQNVFAAPSSDVVTISANQVCTITGQTQFGDELVEDNGEFLAVASA